MNKPPSSATIAIRPGRLCILGRTSRARAVFNRLDAEPGVTQWHSKNPPVSPLRKGGKKTRRRRLSPPCEGGGRGGESRGACNASENRSRVGRAQRGPADL